jgi:uncharacterized membrane protein
MRIQRATLPSCVLALAGIAVASYMVWIHYQETALICGIGDCEQVQTSSYAELAGVPIAWLGLIMFLAVLGLLILRDVRPDAQELATVALFGILLGGTVYVAYLTYLEIWVIEAICQWCVTFAIIMVLLFILTTIQLGRLFVDPSS